MAIACLERPVGAVWMCLTPGARAGLRRTLLLIGIGMASAAPTLAAPTPTTGVPVDLKRVAALLDAAACIECHSADGVASDSRLVFPSVDASPDRLTAFGEEILELVDPDGPAESRLFRKPTALMSHGGGERLRPDSADATLLRAWVASLGGAARPPQAAALLQFVRRPRAETGGRVLRRLTARQFDNTVRDLLGDTTAPGRLLPPEDFVDGFKNQHLGQSASPALIESYGAVAETLADNTVRGLASSDPKGLLPCKLPSGNPDCRERFVRTFGRRAFRRPLLDEEARLFSSLFTRQASFAEGVRAVIETMLQAPSFLYLLDSDDPALLPYARASRLSYLLWNTMPDEALLAAAARGELATAAAVDKLAQAMLTRAEAVGAVDEFVWQWLRLENVENAFKDRRAFPMWNPELARSMGEETRRLVRELVWNDRNFMDLFTARYSFITPELAQIYELPPPAEGFAQVAYPETSERAGLLGHGSFLAATSKPSETSPTARGLFIREHFLCQTTPSPPASVNMDLPTSNGDRPLTNRERLEVHLNDKSCAGCHKLIDPIGFGFEKFDAIGRRQEKLVIEVRPPRDENAVQDVNEKRPKGKIFELPLDTSGSILGITDSQLASPREVGRILAQNDQCQLCVAKQVFRYAMGRKETSAEEKVLLRVLEDFRRSGFRFKALLAAVVRATEFGLPAGKDAKGSKTAKTATSPAPMARTEGGSHG